MSPLPSVHGADACDIPGMSQPNSPNPPKTPKSMLRSLFTWRKASFVNHDSAVHPDAGVESRPQTANSKQQVQAVINKPSLSSRSRSDTSVPQRSKTRSRSRRRSRSRCRAVWDPPPLFQAYNQSFMHDTLQIPSKGFLDSFIPRTTPTQTSAKNFDSIIDDEDEVGSPFTRHRRSMSESSTPSLSKKLFFLFENGHILQYKAEGSNDRLPERVVELSRESVAFASDAITGQHYVLEICPYGRAEDEVNGAAPRSAWSRMTLKTPDTKRLAEKLLLVFDKPNVLFNWLIAIRKHIEGLGGLEYQPDAPPLPLPDPKRPLLRHASSEYFKRKNGGTSYSRASSSILTKPDDSPRGEKELPQLPASLSYQGSVSVRSTAASSVVTNTSLERLRESYSGSSTAGTTLGSDVSATSLSPTRETFLPMLSPTLVKEFRSRTIVDRSMPKSPTSPLYRSEGRSPSPDTSSPSDYNGEEVMSSKSSDEMEPQYGSRNKNATQLPQSTDAHTEAHPAQSLPKLVLDDAPIPEIRKSLRQARRKMSSPNADPYSLPNAYTQTGVDEYCEPKIGLGISSKGGYGLFPKKLSIDVKLEPLVVPEQDNIPGLLRTQASDHLKISVSPIEPEAAAFGETFFASSAASLQRPAAITLTSLLAPRLDIDQPMRSPAVTDAMLASNFGTSMDESTSQPATPIAMRVPSFGDMKIDKQFFESLKESEAQAVSPPPSPKPRSLAPRRSMPNFRYGTASMVSAPLAPPPSVPLPAIPFTASNEGQTSRSATSNKRGSTQSPGNRRASTRSASSIKKSRSPAPSFSLPPLQTRETLSSYVRSPVSSELEDGSPYSASSAQPKTEISAATIGQVSVVSAPPRPPTPKYHQASASTSSMKSQWSRKHTRTSSGKSIHNSIASVPQITHFIKPSCGPESDSELCGTGCFGVSNTRTNTA